MMPLVGPIVDRYSRKKIIIISQLFTIFSLGLFTLYWDNGAKHILAIVILLKIAIQASDQFTSAAQQAAKVHLVLEDDLTKLAGYSSGASSLSGIISAVAGAALYAFLPFSLFIALEILTECITLVITLTLDFSLVENKEKRLENDNGTFQEGITYVRKQKFLVAFILMCTGLNFFGAVLNIRLPMLLIRDLEISNFQYGITESAFSIGMLVSGIIIGKAKQPSHPFLFSWKVSFFMAIITGFIGTVIFLPKNSWLITVIISLLLIVYGSIQEMFNIPIMVWLQKEVPTNIQGRFFNVFTTIATAAMPIGGAMYGILFDLKFGNNALADFVIFAFTGVALALVSISAVYIKKLNLKEAKVYTLEESSVEDAVKVKI